MLSKAAIAELTQAHKRIERHGWSNVKLVETDVTAYVEPDVMIGNHGVVSSL